MTNREEDENRAINLLNKSQNKANKKKSGIAGTQTSHSNRGCSVPSGNLAAVLNTHLSNWSIGEAFIQGPVQAGYGNPRGECGTLDVAMLRHCHCSQTTRKGTNETVTQADSPLPAQHPCRMVRWMKEHVAALKGEMNTPTVCPFSNQLGFPNGQDQPQPEGNRAHMEFGSQIQVG